MTAQDGPQDRRIDPPHERLDRGLAASLLLWGGYFLWLWPRMLQSRSDGLYAGWRLLWADWSFHFAYANVFADRRPAEWMTHHPLFAGIRFGYPFAADALSGLLMRAGAGRIAAFLLPSLLVSLALVALLHRFYRARSGSGRQAFFASCLFFTSGGLGFLRLLGDGIRGRSGDGATELATDIPRAGIVWINVVASELLPQRALLLGLALGLVLLLVLGRWQRRGLAGIARLKLVLLGAAAGGLLLVHVHTWIALTAACAVLLVCDRRNAIGWLWFAAGAAVVSVAILTLVYGGVGERGFVAWQPGWLAGAVGDDPPALPMFLWLNWGLFLPLAVAGTVVCRLQRDPIVLAGFGLFAASFLVRFQPHAWDNTKVLTWAHLFLCLPVSALLAHVWRSRGVSGRGLAATLFLLTTLSGGLDLVRLARPPGLAVRMFDTADLALAERFRRVANPSALVLTSDHHHHWVPSLAGRRVVLGYRGWLLAYGIDYSAAERDVRAMFAGGPEAERLLARYGVDYVVIGPTERSEYGADEQFFGARFPVILTEADTRVYAIGVMKDERPGPPSAGPGAGR